MRTDRVLEKQERGFSIARGFTLIEAMVFLFVFSVITTAFYQAWSLGTRQMINSKDRLGATAIADQQMEIIRSLTFDNIGTTHGIVPGTIKDDQDISANTTLYHVNTLVEYIDDPTDGTSATGTDSAPNDYKRAIVTVTWGGGTASEEVKMSSLFSIDGVESVLAGTGILSINILNAAGQGVPGATVHIVNSAVSPAIDFTAPTDASGNLTYPGTPASTQKYQISVSKNGYYPNTTYPPYPTSSFKPVNVPASVVAGRLTSTTLLCDQQSTIEFRTRDPAGGAIPNIGFTIAGGLAIGNAPGTGALVYGFSQAASTDASGGIAFPNRSMGLYTATMNASVTGYRFLRMDPQTTDPNLISLLPGADQTATMVLANKAVSSIIFTVKRASDGAVVGGANVELSDASLGYDVTVTADAFGQAYFPTDATPLPAGTYIYHVSASGLSDAGGNVTVSGSGLVEKSITLSS